MNSSVPMTKGSLIIAVVPMGPFFFCSFAVFESTLLVTGTTFGLHKDNPETDVSS